MADELRRRKAQLEIEEQIAEAIKNSTASLENFAEAQKKITENYKLIKKINQEIAILEKEIESANEDEKKILKSQLETLRQQQQILIGVNKELSKGKNFAKAIGNEFVNWTKELKGKFIPSINDVFSKFIQIDDLAHQTANTIGFQGSKFKVLQDNVAITRDEFLKMGYDLESAYKTQNALSDATGRQVMLTKEASQAIAETARITGMMPEDLATMTGQMEAFGLGAQQSTDIIFQMSKEASDMGLNSGKVIKKFQENLGLLNKLNFKTGVRGLKEMAKFSEKFKLDMSAVASVADKVFRPEGAIEAAAQLQVLGGSLSQLGDPFQLMYKARNAPEELAKSLTKAATASATWDEATKEWKVNAYELDRLKEAASALGMDYSQLVETAKQGAKIKAFEGILSGKGMDPKMVDAITGMAQMGENGAFVTVKGDPVLLKNLTNEQAKILMTQEKERTELAAKARSLDSKIEEIKNRIIVAGVKLFEKLEPVLHKLMDFARFIIDHIDPKYILAGFLALPILEGAWWLLKGRLLAVGFNSGISKGPLGVGGKATGLLGRLFGKKGGVSPVGEQVGMPTTATPQPGAGPGGITKGLNTTDMIKGAAAIAILAGAMFIFAKSLQEFDKLENKWETFGLAAASIGLLGGAAVILGYVSKDLIKGALAIGILSIAMIPLAFALNMMKDVGIETIGVLALGLTALGVAGFVMGLAAPEIIIGAVAIGLLGIAMIPLAYAFNMAAEGITAIMNSFTQMFQVVNADNIGALLLLGPALIGVSLGVFALAASLVTLGAAYLLGGFLGLEALGQAAEDIQTAFKGVDPQGISTAVNSINSIDMEKLNALRDLSAWMAMLGATTTIKFDEALHIDGSIELSGEGGGKSNTDWVKDPIFVSKLKQLIAEQTEKDRRGGRA